MGERIRKINEYIREEASRAIAEEIGPEDFLTVTAVETADDLKSAVIWVSVLGDEEKALLDLAAHKSAIQHFVTGKMTSKYTPRIEFKIDHSQDYVEKIERLLKNDEPKQ